MRDYQASTPRLAPIYTAAAVAGEGVLMGGAWGRVTLPNPGGMGAVAIRGPRRRGHGLVELDMEP